MTLRRQPALLLAAIGLAGCSLAGPPPADYVLGPAPPMQAALVPRSGAPVLELKRVQLPDYLDTTDILERRGDRLVPSPTARWGERLSVGLGRALTAALAARLRGMVVTDTPPIDRPERQLFIDVTAFEPVAGQHVVLAARWTLVEGNSRRALASAETTLIEALPDVAAAAVVAAMTRALERFADQLAAGVQGG